VKLWAKIVCGERKLLNAETALKLQALKRNQWRDVFFSYVLRDASNIPVKSVGK
jgi:hypothetical protein